MTRIHTPKVVLALSIASLLTTGAASFAGDGVWIKNTNNLLWGDTTNWQNGNIADGIGATADFNQVDIQANIADPTTVHLNGSRTLTNLIFGDTDLYVVSGTKASWLLDNNGDSANILTLAGAAPTITVNALGYANAGPKIATISAGIAGSNGLTKAGVGTLVLSGTNTFSGVTTINAGTLQFANRVSLSTNLQSSWTASNLVVGSGATAAFNVGGVGQFTSADIDALKSLGTASSGFLSGSFLGLDTTNAVGGEFRYGSVIADTNSGANALGVKKLGNGTLTLSGANTYTGGTTVTAGTLNFANGSLGTTGAITLSGGRLQWASGNTQDISNRLTLLSPPTVTNVPMLIDTNGNDVTFGTTIGGNAGAVGLVKLGAGTLTLKTNNAFTFLVTGGGTTPPGGGVTVQEGTLKLDYSTNPAAGNRLAGGTLTLKGGTLEMYGGSSAEKETVANTVLYTDTTGYGGRGSKVTRTSGSSELHMGAITRSANGASVNFDYTTTGGGYAFTTTANTNGILGSWATIDGKDWAVGAATAGTDTAITALASYDSNTWALNKNTDISGADFTLSASSSTNSLRLNENAARTITINSGITGTIASGGILVTPNVGANATTITGGTLTATSGKDLVINQFNTLGDLTISSLIAGTNLALTKTGPGRLILTTPTTHTGGTFINGGVLRLSGTGYLPSSNTNMLAGASGRIFIAQGAAMEVENAGLTSSHGIELASMGANNDGGIRNIAGDNTLGNAIELWGDSRINSDANTLTLGGNSIQNKASWSTSLYLGGAGNVMVTDNISGDISIIKDGAGTLTLKAAVANTYTRPTTINAGMLQFAKQASLYNNNTASWTAGNLTVASGATAAFNVGGTGEFIATDIDTIKGLATATGGFKGGSVLGLDTTNAAGGTFSYDSVIADTANGSLGLTKLGTKTLVLSGTNTYSGGTKINGGTLNLGSAQAIGTSGTISFGGGTLQYSDANATDYSSRFSTADNQAISVDTNGRVVTFAAGLTSTGGSLTKAGAGTLFLSGTNTYSGATTITGGTVQFTKQASLPLAANLTVFNGATAVFNVGGTGEFTSADIDTLKSFGTGSTGFKYGSFLGLDTTNAAGGVFTYDSVIDNPNTNGANMLGLVKLGAGTLTLTAANNYSGVTFVNAGTLNLSNSDALRNSMLNLNGGSVVFDSTVATDTFFVGGLTGSGNINLAKNGATPAGVTLAVRGNTTTYSGVLSGAGGLSVSGTASLTLSQANTFTGTTTVDGTLTLLNANALQNSTLNMNGGTAILDQSIGASSFTVGGLAGTSRNSTVALTSDLIVGGNDANTSFNGVLTDVCGLIKEGIGTLSLTAMNSYAGATTVNKGSLIVNGGISGSVTTVNNGGTIGGIGTLGKLEVKVGGNLNPGDVGNGVGTLTSLDLKVTGALNIDLRGTTPGTGHDQVAVNGTVDLTGATLNLSLATFVPNYNDQFLIVDNDGTDAVTGKLTFAGNIIPDGATFTFGSQEFQISYTAGTGNDVALTAVPEPGAAMALLGGVGMLLGMRRRRRISI